LDKLQLKYQAVLDVESEGKGKRKASTLKYVIAKDKASLDALLGAKDHVSRAKAYAHPEENAFGMSIDGQVLDEKYLLRMLGTALANGKRGVDIPDWMPYLMLTPGYVPKEFDPEHDKYSPDAVKLAQRYQKHMRENHPDLADILESDVKRRYEPEAHDSYHHHAVVEKPKEKPRRGSLVSRVLEIAKTGPTHW